MRRNRIINKKNQYMTKKTDMLKDSITPDQKENTTFFLVQWVAPDVAKKLEKSSVKNPEFDVHYQEKEWHEDGDLVQVRLTFRNCGRNLYQQRLFAFLIRTFHTK